MIISALAVAVTSLNGTAHGTLPLPVQEGPAEDIPEGVSEGAAAADAGEPAAPDVDEPAAPVAAEPAPGGSDPATSDSATPEAVTPEAATPAAGGLEAAAPDAPDARAPEGAAPDAATPPAQTPDAEAPVPPADSPPEAPVMGIAAPASPDAPAAVPAAESAPQVPPPGDLPAPEAERDPAAPEASLPPATQGQPPQAPTAPPLAEAPAALSSTAPMAGPALPESPAAPLADAGALADPAAPAPTVADRPARAEGPAPADAGPVLPQPDSAAPTLSQAQSQALADLPAPPQGEAPAEAQTDAPPPPPAAAEEPRQPRVLPRIADDSAGPAGTARLPGTAAGALTDRPGAVINGRLPMVGQAPAAPAEPEPAPRIDPDAPAIDRFAASFANPEGKPVMSIVLIDDGASPIGLQALANFPYPLTFAIDPAWEGATEAMTRYRDAGFEVMILGNLPDGATAPDAETAIEDWRRVLPQAVGVMEGAASGLQASRPASDQLTAIAAQDGLGLLLYPNGLDTARKMARRDGVAAATLFRDFDGEGQDANVIRRFLDHAAFKAGQEGAVIMVGRMRADTISALLLWGLQDRASRVALAPVSTALKAGGAE